MRNKKLLIFVLAIGTFSILNTEVGILGILPVISQRFEISTATSGLFVSMFALIVAIFGSIMPAIVRKINRRKIMLATLLLFIVSNVLGGLVTNFGLALFFRLLPAVLHPVYCSLAFTIAAEISDAGEASKSVSRVMIGVSAGRVLGTPITTLIANNVSYSAAMYFFALVSLVAFFLNYFLLPKQDTQSVSASDSSETSIKKVLVKRSLWVSGAGTILIGSILFVVYGYVSDLLSQLSNFSSTQLSLALFVFGLMSIIGNLVAGNMLSRSPRKLITIYPFLMIVVYLLIISLSQSTLLMFPVVLLWGMIYGIGNNVQQYLISAAIPESLDLANGLFISLGNIGTTIGTSIGGILLSTSGLMMLPVGGIVMLLVTFAVILVRNKIVHSELNEIEN
ncbi:MFS transporter [Companilactobacillus versmoldensis]|uniref:Major facilitator superfamily protein n=1 Tax=Companilactobacillus versmoldensis DSM 14857 = KCTC 3814 TaxID=1423815 RepID=A0A0R1SAV6_9LACO|nr:MFS transporter [Companilactobacillus versmoldensis]KRL66223.1 major facilitator superfamily protein [Companilactobacillus versmoldensis DSM 14857 = KCTC 3814]